MLRRKGPRHKSGEALFLISLASLQLELIAKRCEDLTTIVIVTITDRNVVDGKHFVAVNQGRSSVEDIVNTYQQAPLVSAVANRCSVQELLLRKAYVTAEAPISSYVSRAVAGTCV